MSSAETDRAAFLAEPDGSEYETPGDALEHHLDKLLLEEEEEKANRERVEAAIAKTQYGTFKAATSPERVTIGTALAAVPQFGVKKTNGSDDGGSAYDDFDALADEIVAIEERAEKKSAAASALALASAQKAVGDVAVADLLAKGSDEDAGPRPDDATYGGLLSFVAGKITKKKNKKKKQKGDYSAPAVLANNSNLNDEDDDAPLSFGAREGTYDGIMDYMTAKGRARKKQEKLEIQKAKRDVQAAQAQRKMEAQQKKVADRYGAAAPSERTIAPSDLPLLQEIQPARGKDARLPALEPVATRRAAAATTAGDMPALTAFKSMPRSGDRDDRHEKMRIRALEDQKQRARDQQQRMLMKSLAPASRDLAKRMLDTVRHGPGASLDGVEQRFGALQHGDAERHYFASLALGGALSKIRAVVQSDGGAAATAPADGASLRRAVDEHVAQSRTPMDATASAAFVDALDQFGRYAQRAASSAPKAAQEKMALDIGEHLADALLEEVKAPASAASWNANHPHVALAAVADRLFRATATKAVGEDRRYATRQAAAFWAAPVTPQTWRAVAEAHFV